MPNTTPIPELIALELVDRLWEISTANGYAFDVTEVVRPNRNGDNWKHEDLSIGIIQGPQTRLENLDCPGNPPALAYQTTYTATCVLRESGDPSAVDENKAAAAIVKATVASANDWYSFGGNAIDAAFGDATPFSPGDGEVNGITVPIVVTYRISETDPFEVRG